MSRTCDRDCFRALAVSDVTDGCGKSQISPVPRDVIHPKVGVAGLANGPCSSGTNEVKQSGLLALIAVH